jgi:hypothetical protein
MHDSVMIGCAAAVFFCKLGAYQRWAAVNAEWARVHRNAELLLRDCVKAWPHLLDALAIGL